MRALARQYHRGEPTVPLERTLLAQGCQQVVLLRHQLHGKRKSGQQEFTRAQHLDIRDENVLHKRCGNRGAAALLAALAVRSGRESSLRRLGTDTLPSLRKE